ncbi:MAG TPA: hypothetical protein VHA35_20175 [Dongiaceae bacterium]|jgi:hypothetical protein|nr:hypothetical protein [Dongiaceae bacterium]
MATTGAQATPQPPKKRGLLLMILAVPVALMLLPATLVLIPAMIPTLVARIVDPGPGRHLTITVGSLNFAGALWFLHDLWVADLSFAAVGPTLGNMMGWLAALVGAGCGWTIHWVMPVFSRRIAETKSATRLARLRKRQAELVEQWGEPVRRLAD